MSQREPDPPPAHRRPPATPEPQPAPERSPSPQLPLPDLSRLPADPQRWTARQRSAVVLALLRGDAAASEVAARHGLEISELADWTDRFLLGGQNALRSTPRDEYGLEIERTRRLRQRIGELELDSAILREAAPGPFRPEDARRALRALPEASEQRICEVLEVSRAAVRLLGEPAQEAEDAAPRPPRAAHPTMEILGEDPYDEEDGSEASPRQHRISRRVISSFIHHVLVPTPSKLVVLALVAALYYFLLGRFRIRARIAWALVTTLSYLLVRWVDRRFYGNSRLKAALVAGLLLLSCGSAYLLKMSIDIRVARAYAIVTAISVLLGWALREVGRYLAR